MTSLTQAVLDHMAGVKPIDQKPVKKARTEAVHVLTEEQQALKTTMINSLAIGAWIVEFTKTDGTNAVMECTRDSRLIPSDPAKLNEAPRRDEVPHLLPVYALDRQGWRSFRIANVQRFYKKPESL